MYIPHDNYRKPTAFIITPNHRAFRDFTRVRRNLHVYKTEYDYIHLHNPEKLRGHDLRHSIIFCLNDWLHIGSQELHEIFHIAKWKNIRIERRESEPCFETYYRFQEADLKEDFIKKLLAKLILTNSKLHTFILNNFEYDQVNKNLVFSNKFWGSRIPTVFDNYLHPLWQLIDKGNKHIDGVCTLIQDDSVHDEYINGGRTLPRLSREISELPLHELDKIAYDHRTTQMQMQAYHSFQNTLQTKILNKTQLPIPPGTV